jgi:sugar phosphate isomerase/epimerase
VKKGDVMKQNMSRRNFLAVTAAAATAALSPNIAKPSPKNTETAKTMKIGLYTITYLGIWYTGQAMELPKLMRFIKKQGWEGVEFDTKRPHAAPMDLSKDDRKRLRDLASELDLPITAVSPNCDLSSHIPERREAMICYVRECIKLTRDLGSPICKIFAAWPGVIVRDRLGSYHYTRSLPEPYPDWAGERWDNVVEALKELSKFAQDQGIVLALQNHRPVTMNYKDVLKMINQVGSPALKACIDHETKEAVEQAGELLVHSHYNGEFRRDNDGRLRSTHKIGYGPYVDALVASGYNGFMNWEFCHPAMKFGKRAGIEYVHEQTRMALEYMKQLRSEAQAGIKHKG